MALTSTTDSLSTIPTSATPNTPDMIRAHALWLVALAVWFWEDFEPRVSAKHLLVLGAGALILNTAIVALLVFR